LALLVAVTPADSKTKSKIKTVVGCVQGGATHYQLSAVTKKGKTREYDLAGDRDFAAEVGHKAEARGPISHGALKVTSLKQSD
jgi:hypothetical protein